MGTTYTNKLMVYADGLRKVIASDDNLVIGGAFTAGFVSGDGTGLTNLPAGQLVGALPALDGSALTNLNASNVSNGTLGDSYLSANIPKLNAGTNVFTGEIQAATLKGNGADITDIAAGNITTGTLADARLSANVALYDAAAPTFTNTVTAAAFSGDGALLTNLSAAAVTGAGALSDSVLSSNVLLKNAASNTLSGNLTVQGDLNVGGDIISGGSINVVLQDQFLDLNGNNLTGTEQTGGIAVNVLNVGTTFTVVSFTPGGTGTDPTVVVGGDATTGPDALVNGTLIQVSQSTAANDGQYIVYSATYNAGTAETTILCYGNAASAHPASGFPQVPFVHNQFATEGAGAKVAKITVGVLAVSNGALYSQGPAQILAGDWCYAYGSSTAQFVNSWISLRPASTPSLQTAYNASNFPATINMTAAKGGLTITPAVGETAAFAIQGSDDSELTALGFRLDVKADTVRLWGEKVVGIVKAAGIEGIDSGVLDEGTLVYCDPSGNAIASDNEAVSYLAREVDGAVIAASSYVATVAGTRAVVRYNGSAPARGDLVYLAGGANAGTCQTTVPTTGRVTVVGKCLVAGSAGLCTIIWAPDYIADL